MGKASETAAAVVRDAGSAGGIDEVVALALRGWPEDRELDGCSPAQVQEAAIDEIAKQMAEEMGDWAPDHHQHESVMRARWGGSFVSAAFERACAQLA